MSDWVKYKPYSKGERVSYNGVVYEATANTMATLDSPIWKQVGKEEPKKANSDNYNKSKLYSKDDTTIHNGVVYKALKNTLGSLPGESDAWQDIKKIPVPAIKKPEVPTKAPKVKPTGLYSPKDVVAHKGEIYKPKVNTVGSTIEQSPELWEKTKGKVTQTGKDGEDGERGPRGYTGDKGEQGEQGIQGPIGPRGPKGEKGDAGERGPQGLQGPPGQVKERFVLGGGGYNNRIYNQGSGISLITKENKHAVGLKSLTQAGSTTITDDGHGNITISSTGGSGGSIPQAQFLIAF